MGSSLSSQSSRLFSQRKHVTLSGFETEGRKKNPASASYSESAFVWNHLQLIPPAWSTAGYLCGHFRVFVPLASEPLFFGAECAMLKDARRAAYDSIPEVSAAIVAVFNMRVMQS